MKEIQKHEEHLSKEESLDREYMLKEMHAKKEDRKMKMPKIENAFKRCFEITARN